MKADKNLYFQSFLLFTFLIVVACAKPRMQDCLNKCQSKHSAAFDRVLPQVAGEQFIVFPFRKALFDNFDLYCVILDSLSNCYKKCGMKNPSKTLSYLTEYILCRKKDELLPQVECMSEPDAEHCATECWNQQKLSNRKNDSITLRKLLSSQCDSMRCSVREHCTRQECKFLIYDYYESFSASRRHLLGCWLLSEQLNVEQKKSNAKTEDSDGNTVKLALLGTLIPITVISIIGAVLVYFYKRKWKVYSEVKKLKSDNIEYNIYDKLGAGQFGEIYKAILSIPSRRWFGAKKIDRQDITVEVLNPHSTKKGFLIEAFLLSKLSNENVVKPKGICIDCKPIMVALEFLDGGTLDKYLQKPQVIESVETLDLWRISVDIACGCQYLQRKGIVHRDLRAKSCLVRLQADSSRPAMTKIYNFGFAKSVKSKKQNIKPKHMVFEAAFTAPEGFAGKFDPKYDIWSFGVLLWEVWSWVSKPYGPCTVHTENDISCNMHELCFTDAAQIRHFVSVQKKTLGQWREPCGANFSPSIKRIMELCWLFDPDMRPNFSQIVEDLQNTKEQLENFILIKPDMTNVMMRRRPGRRVGSECSSRPDSFLRSVMLSYGEPDTQSITTQSMVSQRELCTDLLHDAVSAFLTQEDEKDQTNELERQSQPESYATTTTSLVDEVASLTFSSKFPLSAKSSINTNKTSTTGPCEKIKLSDDCL